MTSRRPSAPIGASVQACPADCEHRPAAAGLVEAVEEVRAHGGDDEQRAIRVLQRRREQPVEAPALVRIGEGEQLLELIDGEQEGGVVLLAAAQPVARARRRLQASLRTSAIFAPNARASCSASISTGRSPGIIGPMRRQCA